MQGFVNTSDFSNCAASRLSDFRNRVSQICYISKASFHLSHQACIGLCSLKQPPSSFYPHCVRTLCQEFRLHPCNASVKACPLPIRRAASSAEKAQGWTSRILRFSVSCIGVLPIPWSASCNRKADCDTSTWRIAMKVNLVLFGEQISPVDHSPPSPCVPSDRVCVHLAAGRTCTIIGARMVLFSIFRAVQRLNHS